MMIELALLILVTVLGSILGFAFATTAVLVWEANRGRLRRYIKRYRRVR